MPLSIVPQINVFDNTIERMSNSVCSSITKKKKDSKAYKSALTLTIPILSLVVLSCIIQLLEEKIKLQFIFKESLEVDTRLKES